jgi:protein tyrosine/serine phosphatase
LPRSSNLDWGGCLNVRDLGGHPTVDGSETRFGAVVRADSVRQLTERGWAEAVEYGVRTVVDLRMDRERAEDPPAELPVDVLHVPFLEDDPAAFAKMDAASESAPDYATATRDVYLLFLEHFAPNVAAAISAVARAPEGAVVVHCMGGKDRTGLIAAFLLSLAGVSDEEVATDYALSEERLRPRYDDWLAEAETDADRERIRRIAATPAAAMLGVLDELERRHGGVEAFLLGAGASAEDLALARARLRG